MLRYFVTANFWLFIGLLCMNFPIVNAGSTQLLYEKFGHYAPFPQYAAIIGTPLVLSAMCGCLYCHTSSIGVPNFSLRTLFIDIAILAVLCGLLTIAFKTV
jgi:hypothetical protein